MKILWTHNFAPEIPNSGVFMFESARSIREVGIDVDLLYLGDLRRPGGLKRATAAVGEIASNYDLVHAQFGSACGLATARATQGAKVLTLRGSDWTPSYTTDPKFWLHGRLARSMTLLSLPAYRQIICVSERIGRDVSHRFARSSVDVIPSAVDTNKFVPMRRDECRKQLGLHPPPFRYVLFTSLNRNRESKRLALATEAVAHAQGIYPDLEVLVASGVSHAEMPIYINACDVAICTSTTEGWPNSIKEAMSCNVPFVATDVSDLRSIARRAANCYVVDSTPQALGDALVAVLRSEDEFDVRQFAEEMNFTAFAEAHATLYRQVLH